MQAANRVIFNTGILYAKMLVTMGISLYSTRLVLNALGASDFGIFNLIAGIIAMLSFLNAAMTVSTQRYLSFHQGTGNFEMQKRVFTNSWILHIVIGIFVVVSLLILSPFLFGGFLNIPEERISTAKVIYYFMSISVFFTIISVPFTASLNARENMLWIVVVNIIESFIKLGIALLLFKFIESERLTVYGALMAILSFITFLLYASYCLKNYDECSVKKYRTDKSLIKELGSFAGWNLFGALCTFTRSQGIAVILNIFLGTIINAAYGIANQVAAQLSFFSNTMLRAINPQIMKSEGMNDRKRMLVLSMIASKFGFFLLAFIAIPVIFEMPTVLKLWLKQVPEYTVTFCSLCLISIMANQLTVGLQSAIQATGRIKAYQSVVGGIQLLNLPIAYLFLKSGFPPYSVLVSIVFIEILACILRLLFLKIKAGLSILEYFKRVILKEIIPLLSIIITCWLITRYVSSDYRFLLTGMVSITIFCLSIYFTGLCKDEKMFINQMIKKIFEKIKANKKTKTNEDQIKGLY